MILPNISNVRSRVRVQEPVALHDVKHIVVAVPVVAHGIVLFSSIASFGVLIAVRFGVIFDIRCVLQIESVEGEEEGEEIVVDALVGDLHRLDGELGEVAAVSAAAAQDHVAQESGEGQRLDTCWKSIR